MENSASLTGCNRLTCKGDGNLFRHEDRVNPTSSDDEDGIFRNHRNFPTVFLFSREGVFRQFSVNFPTNESSKVAPAGLDLSSFRALIHYSTTAPHSLYVICVTALTFPSSVLVYLRQYCVFHRQYRLYLRQYCVNLRQYCVFLRQYSVHLHQYTLFLFPQYGVKLRQYCVFFVSTLFSVHFHQYCVFLHQYCVNLCQYCVILREYSAGG
jgi:hypothetical protein